MEDEDALQAIRNLAVFDVPAVTALLAEDCVYHEDPHWLDGRTFRGREEIAGILREYVEVWGTASQEVEWAEVAGGGVLAGIRQRGQTPRGQVPIDQVWTFVFRFRGDSVAEFWAFADEAEGRRKAAEIAAEK
jgi:ketosteroid isomerase-like protein